MGYFKRAHNGGGQHGGSRGRGPSRGGNSYGGGGSRGGRGGYSDEKISYKTRCNDCGNDCTVPFRPNGSKPVLCSDCFQQSGGGSGRSNNRSFGGGGRSFNKPSYDRRPAPGPDVSKDLKKINDKLDAILAILDAADVGYEQIPEDMSPDIEEMDIVDEVEDIEEPEEIEGSEDVKESDDVISFDDEDSDE
jgi:CxxC-x17-CxxC domain-containing protein